MLGTPATMAKEQEFKSFFSPPKDLFKSLTLLLQNPDSTFSCIPLIPGNSCCEYASVPIIHVVQQQVS